MYLKANVAKFAQSSQEIRLVPKKSGKASDITGKAEFCLPDSRVFAVQHRVLLPKN